MVTAIIYGNTEILKILVDKAPSMINLPMLETGWTPLMFAANLGK